MVKIKTIFVILLVWCSCITFAQNKIFDKYADTKGVTSVYISKTMLQMMPNMKTQGIDIGHIAGQLESVNILTTETPSISKSMRYDMANFDRNKEYEQLMRVKDITTQSVFYIKKRQNKVHELIMFVDEPGEFVIIQITGNLTLQDIQNITKGVK